MVTAGLGAYRDDSTSASAPLTIAHSERTLGPLPFSGSFRLVDVVLHVMADDREFLEEFSSVFGGDGLPSREGSPKATFHASVSVKSPELPDYGRLKVSGDQLPDPAAFLLETASPTVPIRRLETPWLGETALGIGLDPEPALRFRGDECLFRLSGRWRRILAHFLFLRLMRLREDALFFHAASLGVRGTGVLLVGPKGSGKSTLSLALAARGHNFLGDETACYLPASGDLLPFRRPVGIKPGPQATAVVDALARGDYSADKDGVRRVEVEALIPGAKAEPVALGAVVFLQGFRASSALSRLEAGREELSLLQPLPTSLGNRPATQRVFEMVRLLSRVRAYRLLVGDPDETAKLVEESLGE